MFRTERQDAILERLRSDGSVKTLQLASAFGVSEDSIRKDLQQLAAEGRLRRVYGGAIPSQTSAKRLVTARTDDQRSQKLEIAKKAYELIEQNTTVFLDSASTNLYLADLLAHGSKRIVVVSNMFEVLKRVAAGPKIQAQCLPGTVSAELNGVVGSATTKMLERMRFDVAFIGALCVDLDSDAVTTFDIEDGTVKQTVLASAERSYVMADSHKFMQRGGYRYAHVSDFTGIVTDAAGAANREAVENLGVALL